jgi:hypothetical protein
MGKVKSWMMEMEEWVYHAVSQGMTDPDKIREYVKENMECPINDKYVDSITEIALEHREELKT